MYPLVPDFRERLGLPCPEDRKLPAWVRAKPLGVFEGLKGDAWASQELAGAEVGNKANAKRLVFSAARIAQSPHTSTNQAFGADTAAQLGWFRFVDNSKVTPQGILAGTGTAR
ncbi:MAG: transposase [Desulfovibrio sp.]|nr:transposase [Desulfovibrio sp.]